MKTALLTVAACLFASSLHAESEAAGAWNSKSAPRISTKDPVGG